MVWPRGVKVSVCIDLTTRVTIPQNKLACYPDHLKNAVVLNEKMKEF